jgi:hypothetical protein
MSIHQQGPHQVLLGINPASVTPALLKGSVPILAATGPAATAATASDSWATLLALTIP